MKQLTKVIFTAALFLSSGLLFAKGISVEDAYVREVPPGIKTSLSFLTLKNDSDKEVFLIKASSDVAKNVELHEHVHKDGMMEMRQVEKIIIPANGVTHLEPSGLHIMLIGLTRKIKSGDRVEIALEFDDGSKQIIKAEVKKIIDGLKKNSKKTDHKKMNDKNDAKKKALSKHINPMPNLIQVYIKMGDQLNVSKEQAAELKAGIEERGPAIKELISVVAKIEADIEKSAFNDDQIEKIDQLANNLMHERLSIIKGKTDCRESIKKILNEKQFQKLTQLYRANFMKTSKMDEDTAKTAMIKHTNPIPNLMIIVKTMSDKLNLSKNQASLLKQWNDERDPIMAKQFKAIIKMEADLKEATLSNETTDKIAALSDGIMQVRMKIIRGKLLCRDNMRRILDDKQYANVKELYKSRKK